MNHGSVNQTWLQKSMISVLGAFSSPMLQFAKDLERLMLEPL